MAEKTTTEHLQKQAGRKKRGHCYAEHPGCDNSGLCNKQAGHKGKHQCGQCGAEF